MTQFDELIAPYKTACRKLPCVDARAAESSALQALKDYVAELEARRDQDLTLIADGFELASQIQALKARDAELVEAIRGKAHEHFDNLDACNWSMNGFVWECTPNNCIWTRLQAEGERHE